MHLLPVAQALPLSPTHMHTLKHSAQLRDRGLCVLKDKSASFSRSELSFRLRLTVSKGRGRAEDRPRIQYVRKCWGIFAISWPIFCSSNATQVLFCELDSPCLGTYLWIVIAPLGLFQWGITSLWVCMCCQGGLPGWLRAPGLRKPGVNWWASPLQTHTKRWLVAREQWERAPFSPFTEEKQAPGTLLPPPSCFVSSACSFAPLTSFLPSVVSLFVVLLSVFSHGFLILPSLSFQCSPHKSPFTASNLS